MELHQDGDQKKEKNFNIAVFSWKTKVYVNNKIVLLDNLLINPRKDDVTKLGFFEGYENFGTLLVINKNINVEILEDLRNNINNLNLPIYFGISELEVSGFVSRVLGEFDSKYRKCNKFMS